MAYVVRRPQGRFEIRESIHTPEGPRSRSLANFAVLTDAVLAAAEGRSERPFDRERVRVSALRAGAPIPAPQAGSSRWPRSRTSTADRDAESYASFVATSRRMARTTDLPGPGRAKDPGRALIELLGFADQVTRSLPPRSAEPLAFPPLARLAGKRGAAAIEPRG